MDDTNENTAKQLFGGEYMNTWYGKLRFWFLVRKVRRQKITTLWEAYLDKQYYETQHKDNLNYNDSADRTALYNERQKTVDKQDQFVIASLEDRISEAKAVKQNYYKNEQFILEIKNYINMLDEWINQN